jgi:hypothetical protein
LCFLIAGIVKSSIALLVVSLIGTAAATFILLSTADLARRRAWESAGLPLAAGGPGAAPPGTQPVLMYVPVDGAGVAPVNGGSAPITGYDDMTADAITKLVTSGALTDEQLDAVRRYERSHAGRKTVLDRVERALRG